MPKSKSKSSARAAPSKGLPKHPATNSLHGLIRARMGIEEPLRLPDMQNAPTAATVLRHDFTLSSDASGEFAFAVGPSLSQHISTYAVTAGALAATPTTTPHSQYAAFVAEARMARLVKQKVSLTYIGAEQEIAGYISVASKTSTLDMNSQTTSGLHTGARRTVRSAEGLVAYNSALQDVAYGTPSSASFQVGYFNYVVLVGSGLPLGKPLFRVRVTTWLEYFPVEGALSEGELVHEPHDPATMSVHGELSADSTSVHTHAESASFYGRVVKSANAAYHVAQPFLQAYVVPQARKYLMTAGAAWAGNMLALGA